MKKDTNTKSTADAAIPHSTGMQRLSEKEKQALELQEHAEHEENPERARLQKAAERKVR